MTKNETGVLIQALSEKADRLGIDALNELQKTVLIPYWALGFLWNGGFRHFFEGAYEKGNVDLGDVARRLRALGLDSAADACQEAATRLFGAAGQPPDRRLRQRLLDKVDWDSFDPLERVINRLTWDGLDEAVAEYGTLHAAELLG